MNHTILYKCMFKMSEYQISKFPRVCNEWHWQYKILFDLFTLKLCNEWHLPHFPNWQYKILFDLFTLKLVSLPKISQFHGLLSSTCLWCCLHRLQHRWTLSPSEPHWQVQCSWTQQDCHGLSWEIGLMRRGHRNVLEIMWCIDNSNIY